MRNLVALGGLAIAVMVSAGCTKEQKGSNPFYASGGSGGKSCVDCGCEPDCPFEDVHPEGPWPSHLDDWEALCSTQIYPTGFAAVSSALGGQGGRSGSAGEPGSCQTCSAPAARARLRTPFLAQPIAVEAFFSSDDAPLRGKLHVTLHEGESCSAIAETDLSFRVRDDRASYGFCAELPILPERHPLDGFDGWLRMTYEAEDGGVHEVQAQLWSWYGGGCPEAYRLRKPPTDD